MISEDFKGNNGLNWRFVPRNLQSIRKVPGPFILGQINNEVVNYNGGLNTSAGVQFGTYITPVGFNQRVSFTTYFPPSTTRSFYINLRSNIQGSTRIEVIFGANSSGFIQFGKSINGVPDLDVPTAIGGLNLRGSTDSWILELVDGALTILRNSTLLSIVAFNVNPRDDSLKFVGVQAVGDNAPDALLTDLVAEDATPYNDLAPLYDSTW